MKEQIQKNILRTLRDASGHPLPTDVLMAQVRDRTRPFPHDEEIRTSIQALKGIHFILTQDNELEPENPCWLLGEKGEAYIIKKNL